MGRAAIQAHHDNLNAGLKKSCKALTSARLGQPSAGGSCTVSGVNHSVTRQHRSLSPVAVSDPSANASGHPCRPRASASSVGSAHCNNT